MRSFWIFVLAFTAAYSFQPLNRGRYQLKVLKMTDNVRVLGVCGGIGSGKSAACNMLVSKLNCLAHIDADSIGHSVYEPGSQAVTEIAAVFGSGVLLDGEAKPTVNRRKLGSIVFGDEKRMRDLEKIVWPHVEAKIKQEIVEYKERAAEDKEPVIVVEAAVLLDAGWQNSILDGVWVVRVPREVAIDRITTTRQLSRDEAIKRIEGQQSRRGIGNLSDEIKNKVVTSTIDNAGSLEELEAQLKASLSDPNAWY